MSQAAPVSLRHRERSRLLSIDLLRGVAILAVLAVHIPHDAPGGWREHPFFLFSWLAGFGYFGVPLFILISGFCIHRRAAESRQRTGSYHFSWRQFWVRRFIRLYPPYVAAILLSLFAAFLLHQRFPDPTRFLGWDLVTHLLLMHNLTWEYATGLGNGAFWSLGTEEQLYGLYFLLSLMLTWRSPRFALIVAAAVTVTWRLVIPHFSDSGIDVGAFTIGKWYQWPLQYWLHWALGAIAVEAWFGQIRLPPWCRSLPFAAMLVGVGMLANNVTFDLLANTSGVLRMLVPIDPIWRDSLHNIGELVVLLGFFCVLNGLLQRDREGVRIVPGGSSVAQIGRISYSIYLVHIPVIYTLQSHLTLGAAPAEWLLRYLAYGSSAILCGYLFHLGVERWFLDGRWPWPRRIVLASESST